MGNLMQTHTHNYLYTYPNFQVLHSTRKMQKTHSQRQKQHEMQGSIFGGGRDKKVLIIAISKNKSK